MRPINPNFYLITISYLSMLNKLTTNKNLALIGTLGSIVASYCLAPEDHALKASIGVLAAAGTILLAKGQWVESGADEWLLVIRDGKLIKSGIGLKTFIGLTDTIVKFPSRVEQVNFTANNVTVEMQGVQITGFAFWSVYREEDGPFRCYKYMEGNNANSNVQAMCESVLRSQIANSTLDQVLRNRNLLRDAIKLELKDQFKGWGVWLETVEITEVTISSNRLFKDLQADFRQATRLKAEQIELLSNEKITEARQTSNFKIGELNQNASTRKQQVRNTQLLKRKEYEANFQSEKNKLEIKKMEKEKQLQLQRYNNQFLIQDARVDKEQTLEKMKQDFEKESVRKVFEVDKEHNDLTLEKYEIDTMEKVYRQQNIRGVSINQFSGGEKEALAALLPSIGYGMAQVKTA